MMPSNIYEFMDGLISLWTPLCQPCIQRLSEGGEKDIGKYNAALATVFNRLTKEEQKCCKDNAAEWNMQQK